VSFRYLVPTALMSFIVSVGTVAVPSAQKVSESIRDLVLGLAQSGRPVGAILPVTDFEIYGYKESRPLRAGEQQLTLFAAQHPHFVVERQGQAARVIHRETPRALIELLNRPRYLRDPAKMSASAAVVHVVAALIREQPADGVLGSGQTPSRVCRIGEPVALNLGESSALQLLDSIVAQVHGLAWFVLYDPSKDLENIELGLWCPDGMCFRVGVPLS